MTQANAGSILQQTMRMSHRQNSAFQCDVHQNPSICFISFLQTKRNLQTIEVVTKVVAYKSYLILSVAFDIVHCNA